MTSPQTRPTLTPLLLVLLPQLLLLLVRATPSQAVVYVSLFLSMLDPTECQPDLCRLLVMLLLDLQRR